MIDPRWDWLRALATPQFVVTVMLFALSTYATHMVLTGDFSADLKAAVIGALVISGIANLQKFWLNSTNDSEKKNETISDLAKGTGSGTNGKPPEAHP